MTNHIILLFSLLSYLASGFRSQHFRCKQPRMQPCSVQPLVKQSEFLRDGMPWRPLGNTDILVSKACLGGLMWGRHVSERVARDMMTVAFDEFGVNFIDTSELYPMPNEKEYFGEADRIIYKWMRTRDRSSIILSSKVAGYTDNIPYIRKNSKDDVRVNRAQVRESVEASLKRLGTDYIDLIQIEWPDRYSQLHSGAFFDLEEAKRGYVSFQEQVDVMQELAKEGKIRQFGLSNETPFGLMKFHEAMKNGCPSDSLLKDVVSVQNAYNMIERNSFETSMLEACHYTNTSFLAHSPLAGGALSGKYDYYEMTKHGELTREAEEYRLNKYIGYTCRYKRIEALAAVTAYKAIAVKIGLTQTQLALSWCYSRPFITSTIIGASTVEQMRDNLMAMNCPMTEGMENDIFELYVNQYRDPTTGNTEIEPNYGDPHGEAQALSMK